MYTYRNPAYNRLSTVDCEIEHPQFGWIPFTADPNDVNADGAALYAAIMEAGGIAEYTAPILSQEELRAVILEAVQSRLDDFARTRNYDSILSACTYATDAVPQFAAEGQRAIELRGQTWAKLYEMLAEVQAGTRAIPAGYADIEEELPALSW